MFLALDQDGLPTKDALLQLTIDEWESWLQNRNAERDPFTGQVLYGSGEPYALVRRTIEQYRDPVINTRFVEACGSIIHRCTETLISQKRRGDELVRTTVLLMGILDMLGTSSPEILHNSVFARVATDVLPRLFSDACFNEYSESNWFRYAIAAVARFLCHFDASISEEAAVPWFAFTETRVSVQQLLDKDRVERS